MNYIEVSLAPEPFSEEICDVLASLLAPLDYDSFATEDDCLKAYCPVDKYSEDDLKEMLDTLPLPDLKVNWSAKEVETQDWNAEWEDSVMFEPIIIGSQCCIHGPKSKDVPSCKYDVVIAPKMSSEADIMRQPPSFSRRYLIYIIMKRVLRLSLSLIWDVELLFSESLHPCVALPM